MSDVIVSQRTGEEEIEKIANLVNVVEAFDKHKALGDHAWLDLVHGGRKGVYGFTAHYKNSSQLIGYAQVSKGNENWALEIVVHPSERSPTKGVTKALVDRSVDAISKNGGGHVHVWLAQSGDDIRFALTSAKFSPGRRLVQMRRPLPLEKELSMTSIETRPFESGKDDIAWLDLNNLAFSNHPEQGGWTEETLAQRKSEPWFDPNGFLLSFIDDEMAAFCWTKIHADNRPALGEIYVIGVHPKYSGHGLGRRICVSALNYLAEQSVPIAMLYVDQDNTRAYRMYEHLGFHPDHIDRAYIRDVQVP